MILESSTQLTEVQVIYKSGTPSSERKKITGSNEAYQVLKELFNPDTIEHHEIFVILLLNRANQVLGWSKISQGGISGTVVDNKIIFQIAIKTNASGIVLAHNHPSGGLKPSEQDLQCTKKLKEGAKMLDLAILDHLIISTEGYHSFADEGLM